MSLLDADERQKLHEVIQSVFRNRGDIEMFLSFSFNVDLDTIVSEAADKSQAVFEMIRWAERSDKLQQLLHCVAKAKRNPTVTALTESLLPRIEQRRSRVSIPADPFEACMLRGGLPFVNRALLRSVMRELSNEGGSRVLVIDGPKGSGKSYTRHFVSHIAESHPNSRVLWINVEDSVRTRFTPDQFAISIVTQIGRRSSLAYIPIQQAQTARWIQELRDWLVGEISQTTETWWLLCDGLSFPDIPTDTKDLLKLLMRSAHVNLPTLRIVAISYSEDMLPTDIVHFIRREQITTIGTSEVKQFFNHLNEQGVISVQPDAIDKAVELVLQHAAAGDLGGALHRATSLLRGERL